MSGTQGSSSASDRGRQRGGKRNLTLGRAAGVLFLSGTCASIPANILLSDPDPGTSVHLLNLLGFLTGVICLLLPWDRMHRSALHLIPAVATGEIVLTVTALGVHGQIYLWFFLLGSVFSGYAFRNRAHVAFHTSMACAGFVSTAIFAQAWDHDSLVRCVVAVPTLATAALAVAWLREGMEAREAELMRLTEAHERDARTDSLTGLGNRRALTEALDDVLGPGGGPTLFALFDLDGFKLYNDRFGHPAGDTLLARLGERLATVVHADGVAFRLGGDEFCVLIDAADERRAEERLGECVEALTVSGPGFEVTSSFGRAMLPAEAATASGALAVTDTRMYECKSARRSAGEHAALHAFLRTSAPAIVADVVREPATGSQRTASPTPRPAVPRRAS